MYTIKVLENGKEKSIKVISHLREGDSIGKINRRYCIVRRNISKYEVKGAEDWN